MSDYRGFRDLIVYQKSYKLAIDIFRATKSFPREEIYSLTDQLRRASRSVSSNIAEGWPKRRYPKSFVSKLIDSAGEAAETEHWLDMSRDLGYLSLEQHDDFLNRCQEVEKMLASMIEHPEKFCRG